MQSKSRYEVEYQETEQLIMRNPGLDDKIAKEVILESRSLEESWTATWI